MGHLYTVDEYLRAEGRCRWQDVEVGCTVGPYSGEHDKSGISLEDGSRAGYRDRFLAMAIDYICEVDIARVAAFADGCARGAREYSSLTTGDHGIIVRRRSAECARHAHGARPSVLEVRYAGTRWPDRVVKKIKRCAIEAAHIAANVTSLSMANYGPGDRWDINCFGPGHAEECARQIAHLKSLGG